MYDGKSDANKGNLLTLTGPARRGARQAALQAPVSAGRTQAQHDE